MEKYEKILDELGVRMHLKGYTYWAAAIEYGVNHVDECGYAFNMTEVRTYIADKYNDAPSNVDRALRHVVDTTPNMVSTLKAMFNVNYKFSSSTILACLVRIVKNGGRNDGSNEV